MTPEQKVLRLARLRERYATEPRYRERVLEQQREYRQKPEYRAKTLERSRRWASKNKEHLRLKRQQWYATEMQNPANRVAAGRRARVAKLKAYGLTPDDYQAMWQTQSGLCQVCGSDNGDRRLVVDHDHGTGRIRGLLCHMCNAGLGHFRDNPAVMRRAVAYLEDSK